MTPSPSTPGSLPHAPDLRAVTNGKTRRVRTPTVLQMEAMECGAAALSIVLGYYGRFVPLEELRVACGVSRDGSKASNVARAGRLYGLAVKGYRKETEALLEMRLPLIVFWNFNHFLVVEGFGRDRVYVNDPATGPRTVTWAEFDAAFTGVVLACEPGPEFRKGGAPYRVLPALRSRLRGCEAALLYVILVSLVLVVPGLVIPLLTRVFVDGVLVRGMTGMAGPVLMGMLFAGALRAGLTWLQQTYLLRLETRLALDMSSRFFWHVLRLPVEFFTQRHAGEVGTRVMINDRLAALLSGELATHSLNALALVFYVLLMLQYDAVLTITAVLFAVVNLFALQAVARRRTDLNQRMLQDRGRLMGTSMAGLQMIETLKATGGEAGFFARWSGLHANVTRAEQEMDQSTYLLSIVPMLLGSISAAVILGLGGLRVMDGHLTLGSLVAFQSLVLSFNAPVEGLVTFGSSIQEVQGSLKRLEDVLDCPLDPVTTPAAARGSDDDAVYTGKLSGRLEIRELSFGYSRLEEPLIEGFSLSIKPGSRVALVGGSGSGKSTVARLVAGLIRPWSGEILFDGRQREELPRSVLANSLSFVDQDIFLFEGSIRDNLTLWDPTVPEAQLVRAARDAAIHEEIVARPGGYESQVDEEGRNLSGGQRQRLEIARALVCEPSILILDEATSALDPVTEEIIDHNLRRRGVTCLIVAHRLSTIRDCDEILVMEHGRVVQRGTHAEMSRVEGPYARLLEMRVKRKSYLDFA